MDQLFASGGEMGALMSELDWSGTSIGPPDTWPQGLRTATSICLESRFPILLWWGERLTMLYNDAYRVMLGQKHPAAMGRDGKEVWSDIWDVIGPVLDGVLHRGEATWSADQRLLTERNGFREETYFTFAHSPIRDEDGVAGVFTAVSETTQQVVGARRLALLRALADAAGGRRDEAGFLGAVTALLGTRPADLPFAVLYLFEDGGARGRRALATGATAAGAPEVDLAAAGPLAEVLAHVVATQRPVVVDDLAGRVVPAAGDATPTSALALPVRALGADEPIGVLLAGVNPLRPLDTGQHEFLELAAASLASGLADARATATERRRAQDRYDREHALVEEFQRSLLPEGLPVLPEVEVAARYLPAEGDSAVGGDWYDVLRLPDERIMVVVGDVVGHGMRAAATMAHLRTATRAYAGEGHAPGELVHRVSRLVERTGVGLGSTLLLAVLDADTGALEYAGAGHPPALVTGPAGSRWLAFGLAPPLGLSSSSMPRAEQDVLGADETLVLFTDGLVERRAEDLEDRLRALAAIAPPEAGGPPALLDALVGGMEVVAGRDDDVVLLAVRRVPARATLALQLGTGVDLTEMRQDLREWMGRAGIEGDVADEVLLVVSEAVINALEHAGLAAEDAVSLRAQAYDGRLRIVVRDSGRWRRQGPAHARGHGLRLIRALMDDVALDVDGDGTRLEVSRELTRR